MARWLRLCAPNEGVQSLVRELTPHALLQARSEIPSTAARTWGSQINKYCGKRML